MIITLMNLYEYENYLAAMMMNFDERIFCEYQQHVGGMIINLMNL
jgi:hypothetical protein